MLYKNMGATSVTGTGTGDAHTRVAYLSSNLPQLELLETTTNPQNMIAITSGGGGGGGSSAYRTIGGGINNDYSVNKAKTFINYLKELVLQVDLGTSPAGNYYGGGVGSKPIAGIPGWEGILVSDIPQIRADTTLRTLTTANTLGLGLSFNAFLDLAGDGSGPIVNMVITNTLVDETGAGVVDNKGFSGQEASVYDFDILDFIPGNFTPSTRTRSRFYISNDLPGAVGTVAGGWTQNPMTLDILLTGGAYPRGGTQTIAYPNARLIACVGAGSCVNTDGGLPKGTLLPAIIAQTGNSANALRSVTHVSMLVFIDPNGTSYNLLNV